MTGRVCYHEEVVRGAWTELRGPGEKGSIAPHQDGEGWTRQQGPRGQRVLGMWVHPGGGGLETKFLKLG